MPKLQVPFIIAMRYMLAQRRQGFISFISGVSFLGMMLGVAVLITVLAVMEGFVHDVKHLFLQHTPHLDIRSMDHNGLTNHSIDMKELSKAPNVIGISAYRTSQTLIAQEGAMKPSILYALSDLNRSFSQSLPVHDRSLIKHLKANQFSCLMGAELAYSLGLQVGDHFTMVVPKPNMTLLGMTPRYRAFKLAGILTSQALRYRPIVLIDFIDAGHLLAMGNQVTGIRLWLKDPYQASNIANELAEKLKWPLQVRSWVELHQLYFRTVRTEKTMMMMILSLIILIAAFNLVTSLVMLVNQKRSSIAVLKTMGLSRSEVVCLFMLQGMIIGTLAVVFGVLLGLFLAHHISAIASFLETLMGVKLIPPALYTLDYLPSYCRWSDVSMVASIAWVIAFLATIYPAWRAAGVDPAQELRHE
jgi:lipoprotein-releasing system permease protein